MKAIYILGESRVNGEEETSHDTLNMTCFNLIKELRGENKLAIDCYVFFEYQTTSIVFQKYAKITICESLFFIPYNFYELHAQKAIGWEACLGHSNVQLDRFDHKEVNVDKHVHLIIIGMSRMGQALGLEAIRVCHYPNFAHSQMLFEYGLNSNAEEMMRKRRTKITFIDCNMKEELEIFQCWYKRLFDEISWSYLDSYDNLNSRDYSMRPDAEKNNPDIELEFINGRIQSGTVLQYLQHLFDDESAVVTIASCLSKSNQSLASLLFLPKKTLENAEIMLYQPDSTELVDSISINDTPNKIKAFGMTSKSVDLKHIEALESMSKRIYYVYRRTKSNYTLKDFTIDSMKLYENQCSIKDYWEKEETWRWANRYLASGIWQKMHYVEDLQDIEKIIRQGLTKNDGYGSVQEEFEGLMARVEHNRYCIEQWLLDREDRGSDYHAFKTYKYLKTINSPLVKYPTSDQAMSMAIPYIIGNSLSMLKK